MSTSINHQRQRMQVRHAQLLMVATLFLCPACTNRASAADCDGNGIDDSTQISAGTSPDCDGNGVPDHCDRQTAFSADQVITTVAYNVQGIAAADLDGDGDIDLISTSWNDDKLAWYENTDAHGGFGHQRVISTESDGVNYVFPADIDGDGDLDLVTTAILGKEVAWFENLDGTGNFGPLTTIISGLSARAVVASDLDGDADLDVLVAFTSGNRPVAWFENTDGQGSFGPLRSITSLDNTASSVFAADVDNDGDVDVISAASSADKIAWYESVDGLGGFGAQQVISTAADGPESVIAADIDGDGDLDVASASLWDNKIAWYANTNGLGSYGPQQIVTINASFAQSVFASDLDGDGDLDLLSASLNDNKVAWYENLNGMGDFGPQQIITTTAGRALHVIAVDLDGDGDSDVISSASQDNTVAWYENFTLDDCNDNSIPDDCDLANETSTDCNGNDIPDDCETDCNENGMADECEIAVGMGTDCNMNEVLDDCEPDCNTNGVPDDCDISFGTSNDCSGDGVPDTCEADCDTNGIPDICDIAVGNSLDCNSNNIPDDCEVANGSELDCNGNAIPDDCEFQTMFSDRSAIDTSFNGAWDLIAADLDGDNDLDIIASSINSDEVTWYENTDGLASFGPRQVITSLVNGPRFLAVADVDGDNDLDVLSSSEYDGKTAWYKNTDAMGTFGPQLRIDYTYGGGSIWAVDIDSDGDIDVLSLTGPSGVISWYENTDGLGTFGSRIIISFLVGGSGPAYAADIDNDGDYDVITVSNNGNSSAWYENTDGNGNFGAEQIFPLSEQPSSISAADLDLDGDLDVVLSHSTFGNSYVSWHENVDGEGNFGPRQTITTDIDLVMSVFTADLDGDDDFDVLSASYNDDKIAWYENVNGQGAFGPQQIISDIADSTRRVVAGDLDGDGDVDVLSTAYAGDRIDWYENSALNDCNVNRVLDECDINRFWSSDCNNNNVPDDCEPNGEDGYLGVLIVCLAGPNSGQGPGCTCFDFDEDGDNDLVDFAVLQTLYNQ